MSDEFVSEPVYPHSDTMNTHMMAAGAPGLPLKFTWRDREYTVQTILETWKESGPCRNGSTEIYLRKHWFKIQTTDNLEMRIYFERQPKPGRDVKKRWWLYSIRPCGNESHEL